MPRCNPFANLRLKLSKGHMLVIQERAFGWAVEEPAIIITPGQSGLFELDTITHECLHITRPDFSEAEVQRVAGDLSKTLWAMGYRRPARPSRKED